MRINIELSERLTKFERDCFSASVKSLNLAKVRMCTATGKLDHSLKQDCATIVSNDLMIAGMLMFIDFPAIPDEWKDVLEGTFL